MNPRNNLSGQQRKAQALQWFAANRAKHVLLGQRALVLAMFSNPHRTATADQVRAAVVLPPGMNPVLFGRVPGPLATLGLIANVGSVKSQRPERHGAPTILWLLIDEVAAMNWLIANPAPF